MTVQTPTDPRSVSVRHLREVASAKVENTSLRNVAREIGMSPTGLKKFLLGTAPYAPTLHRLRSWYVCYAALQGPGVDTEDASAALAVLTHDLGAGPRGQTAVVLLDAIATGYEQSGKTQPGWLSELRMRYEATLTS